MTDTIEAELPDGRILEFPAGTDPAVIQQTVKKVLGVQPMPETTGGRLMEGAIKPVAREINQRVEEFGTGVQKGAAGTLGLPKLANDVLNYALQQGGNIGQRLRGREPQPVEFGKGGPFRTVAPSSQDIENFLFKTLPEATGTSNPERLPDDTVGRVLSSTGKMIGSAPIPAMTGFNVAGGVGGGLLNSAMPDKWWAEPAGQLAGAGVYGLAQTLRSTPQQIAGKATQNLGPDDWARAQALQQRGQQAGVPLAANEAIAKTSSDPISSLAGDVRASQRGGAVMEKFFQDRLPQIKGAIQSQTAKVGDKIDDPISIGLRAQQASEKALVAPKIERADAARAFFDRARAVNLPQTVTDDIVWQIDNVAASANPEGPILKALNDIKSKVVAAKGNVGQIDEVLKVYDDILKAGAFESGAPIGEAIRVNVKPVLAGIRDTLKNNVDDYARGMEIYGGRADLGPSMYTSAVKRAENSALTPLANTTPGTSTTAKFETIILGGENARPESIRFAVRALSKQDPDAAANAVRLHLENAMDDAFQRLQSGPNAAAGAKFSRMVGGSEQQRANLFAALDALPANGKAVTGRSAGFKNLLEILDQTGTTPGIGSPTATRGVTNQALANGGALNSTLDAVNIVQGGPIGPLSRWWKDVRMGKGYEELAKILTDPNSVAKLQQLSVLKPSSDKAKLLAAELLAGARGAEAIPPSEP